MNRFPVRKVAVLGAGVMGAQIAAHLVNVKVPVVLFDLPARDKDGGGAPSSTFSKNGIVTRAMLPMFAVVAPAMLIPVLLGARVYIGLSEAAFRRVVLWLLTASGVALLVSALPVLLRR